MEIIYVVVFKFAFVFNGLWIDKRQSEPASLSSAVWEEQEVAFVTQLNVI